MRTSVRDRARLLLGAVPAPRVPRRDPAVHVEADAVYVVLPGHPWKHTVPVGHDERDDDDLYGRVLAKVRRMAAEVVADAGKNSARGWAGFTVSDLRSVIAGLIPATPRWCTATMAQAHAVVDAARAVPREDVDRAILAAGRKRAGVVFASAARGMAEAGATEEEMVEAVRRAIARQVIMS